MLPTFIRFNDLKARRIVANWPQLGHLIKHQGFPPGRYLGERTRVWTEDEIVEWLAGRPAGRTPRTKDEQRLAALGGSA